MFVDGEDGAERSDKLERGHQDRRAAGQAYVREDRVGVVQDARLSGDLLVPLRSISFQKPFGKRKPFGNRSETNRKPFGNCPDIVRERFGNGSETRSEIVRLTFGTRSDRVPYENAFGNGSDAVRKSFRKRLEPVRKSFGNRVRMPFGNRSEIVTAPSHHDRPSLSETMISTTIIVVTIIIVGGTSKTRNERNKKINKIKGCCQCCEHMG